jgi:hypothetical protein
MYFTNPTWSLLQRSKAHQFISILCDRQEAGNTGNTGVTFHLNGRDLSHQFCFRSLATDADGIIGMDFVAEKKSRFELEKITA